MGEFSLKNFDINETEDAIQMPYQKKLIYGSFE